MAVIHGGTDAGPPPRLDLSTNANPYGPSPVAQQAMTTPIGAYPDPTYTRTREAIAAHTGFPIEEIVVGAGATELIYRLVFCIPGPVAAPFPGFGEYVGAAHRYGRPVHPLPQQPDPTPMQLPAQGLVFLTNPGSPDGLARPRRWVNAVQDQANDRGTWVVWDLAYHQLLSPTVDKSVYACSPTQFDATAILLFAPNKAHGCTGLRAGWLRAPAPMAETLRKAQMSWILSSPGAAFLTLQASTGADEWVRTNNLRMHATSTQLRHALAALGWPTKGGHTPWLITQPPHPALAQRLRTDFGIKVRDLHSQGLPGWWRLGTPQHQDLDAVITALNAIAP